MLLLKLCQSIFNNQRANQEASETAEKCHCGRQYLMELQANSPEFTKPSLLELFHLYYSAVSFAI